MRETTDWQQAYIAGIVFYGDPYDAEGRPSDPLMVPVCEQINSSGWVWTGESCQGHPDAQTRHVWAGNTEPMLRLVCRDQHVGDMLAYLLAACEAEDDGLRFMLGLKLWRQQCKGGWTSITAYIGARTVYDRDQGVAAFQRFGAAIQRHGQRIRDAAAELDRLRDDQRDDASEDWLDCLLPILEAPNAHP